MTIAGLLGSCQPARPGLCSLAHRGILFLDELTEYPASVLDALREPLESKEIHLVRYQIQLTWPSSILLVAAANPCRCGMLFEPTRRCSCSEHQVRRHLGKLSGPLIDRFDLLVLMTRLGEQDLIDSVLPENSAHVERPDSRQIQQCWERQRFRNRRHGLGDVRNGDLPVKDLLSVLEIKEDVLERSAAAVNRLGLTARSFHKTLKIARTIADLEETDDVEWVHVAEALQYRTSRIFPSEHQG